MGGGLNIGGALAMLPAVLVFMIPIIAILTAHQRKMAELMHRPQQNPQADQLSNEIQQMRQILTQQTIALDNLATELRNQRQSDISERISESSVSH